MRDRSQNGPWPIENVSVGVSVGVSVRMPCVSGFLGAAAAMDNIGWLNRII